VVKEIWSDPVGSKVIAAGIIGAGVWAGQHFGIWFTTWPVPGWLLGLLVLSVLVLILALCRARKASGKPFTALERYLQRLQDQDARIASAAGPVPPLVSGELQKLFDEINQSCPALLEHFEGHCDPVALRSQISTAVGRVSSRIDASKRG
jgi:hypothetical protein